MISTFINWYALFVFFVVAVWSSYKLFDCFYSYNSYKKWFMPANDSSARHLSKIGTLKLFFISPKKNFHRLSRPIWSIGSMLYHVGLVSLFFGYFLSAGIVIFKIVTKDSIPLADVTFHQSQSYEPSNILAFIFGNAEPFAAPYLFGQYSDLFVTTSLVQIMIASFGNGLLLFSLLSSRVQPGKPKLPRSKFIQRLLVRVLIGMIIWAEISSRIFHSPMVLYGHIILGLSLILLIPLFYLNHIIFMPFAVVSSVRKLRFGIVV